MNTPEKTGSSAHLCTLVVKANKKNTTTKEEYNGRKMRKEETTLLLPYNLMMKTIAPKKNLKLFFLIVKSNV